MKRTKKLPRWKKEQKQKKSSELKIQLALGVGFLIFLALLIVGGWLYKRARYSIWDGKSRLGIVHQDESHVYLQTLLPDQGKMIGFELPFNLVVNVPFGYGEYQLDRIYKLGELEDQGGKILTRTVQDLMGLSVQGFNYYNQTNLTWWDRVRVRWFSSFRVEKRMSLDLLQETGLTETTLPDGSKVLLANQTLTDELVNQYFFDEAVVKEGLSVAVLNASGVDGLAQESARIVNNLGGEVSLVSNKEESNQSQIWVSEKELIDAVTVKQLSNIFNIKVMLVTPVDEYRADVVLIISEDYATLK